MKNADGLLGKNGAFASRLRELYNTAKPPLTLEEVGNAIGVTRQTFSKYLEGKAKPTIENIFNLAQFFKVSADYLLGLRDMQSPDMNIQKIHDKTGLSEEVICSLQREMQIIQRLTNRENVDEALSEFLAFRKFSHFVSIYCGQEELAKYAKKHGYSDIDEILDNEINLTPTKLLQFIPDAVILNELMRGSTSKYTNVELRAVKNSLYDVLSHSPENTFCYIDDPRDEGYIYDHLYADEERKTYTKEEMERILSGMTEEDLERAEPAPDPDPDPVIEELHEANALECGRLKPEEMFAFKILRLQQALTERLERIKKSTNGDGNK